MRKAFTLIELIVALGILAIMLMFASTIFRVSIDAQRMAVANSEIMQKLRVITEQLDADFRGFLPQYGGSIGDHNDTLADGKLIRSDVIVFYANGDFQSTRSYETTSSGSQPVTGDVAAIFYGCFNFLNTQPQFLPLPRERILFRRQIILSSNSGLPAVADWTGEYYPTSLEQCRLNPPFGSVDKWLERPLFDPAESVLTYLPRYLAKGVDNFAISYLRNGAEPNLVEPGGGYGIPWYRSVTDGNNATIGIPRAVMFQFTLYDSKGIIPKGRTFSHIVLLGG